jgi:hypothetical protein
MKLINAQTTWVHIGTGVSPQSDKDMAPTVQGDHSGDDFLLSVFHTSSLELHPLPALTHLPHSTVTFFPFVAQ